MAKTMRAARVHKVGGPLQLDEIPIPSVGPDDVLVKIVACGTQDGDYQLIHGKLPLGKLPHTIGHEPAGTVAEVGANVRTFKAGDRVFVDPLLSCNQCHHCQSGNEVYCESYSVAGMTCFTPGGQTLFARYGSGGFAEYMLVPTANVRPLADEIAFEQAAKLAFLGVALKALERGKLRSAETVLVTGASGALGTCAVMVADALGASNIIAVARDKGRLERVRAINPRTVTTLSVTDDPRLETIKTITGGKGPDLLIDCLAGGIDVVQQSLLSLRKGGRAVLIGGVVGTLSLDYRFFMHQEVDVTGSIGIGRANFRRVADMVRTGVVDFSHFVTHRFPLERANEAIATVIQKTGDPLGVIVTP